MNGQENSIELLEEQALQFLQKGNGKKAAELYQFLITKNPNSSELYYHLGEACFQSKVWDQALKAYQRALQLEPQFSLAVIGIADVSLKLKNYSQAEKLYRHALELDQGLGNILAQSFGQLGNLFSAELKVDEAHKAYQTALSLDNSLQQKIGEAYLFLGDLLVIAEKTDQAQQIYQRARELVPEKDPQQFEIRLGNIKQKQGNWLETLKYYQALNKKYPDNPVIQQLLGKILPKVNQFSLHRAQYWRATAAYENKLQAEIEQGNWLSAKRLCEKIIALDPDNPWLHLHLGFILSRIPGLDPQQAIDVYQHVLELNPELHLAYFRLAEALIQQEDYATAIQHLVELAKVKPEWNEDIAALYEQIAEALLAADELEHSETIYHLVLSLAPNKDQDEIKDYYLRLAQAARRQQSTAKAVAIYSQLINQFPEQAGEFVGLCLETAREQIQQNKIAEAETNLQALLKLPLSNKTAVQALLAHCYACQEERLLDALSLYEILTQTDVGIQEIERYKTLSALYERLQQHTQQLITNSQTDNSDKQLPQLIPDDFKLPQAAGLNNDYGFIEQHLDHYLAAQQPLHLPVSVLIAYHDGLDEQSLKKQLDALSEQLYPLPLLEVVIASHTQSDAINELIDGYKQDFAIQLIGSEDATASLTSLQNLAFRVASYEQLILLDAHSLPEADWLESFMLYLHITQKAILIGKTDTASEETNDENDGSSEENKADTNPLQFDDLKTAPYPFVKLQGAANMAFSRRLLESTGLFDEAFQEPEYAYVEWAYRAYNTGAYFIPVSAALAYQNPVRHDNNAHMTLARRHAEQLMQQKCPLPLYRDYHPGLVYNVPTVSIYITAYNAAPHLKVAIESALHQTFNDLEICIVDDGSSDATAMILREYEHNPRVRVHSQAHQGIAAATATALRMCRGMYIGQLDAEDSLRPEAVAFMLQAFSQYPQLGGIYSNVNVIDAEDQTVIAHETATTFSREELLTHMIISPFRMFKKRDWSRTAGIDEELNWATAHDMWLKLSEVALISRLDKTLYASRDHSHNHTPENQAARSYDTKRVLNKALRRLGLAQDWEVHIADIDNPALFALGKKSHALKQA